MNYMHLYLSSYSVIEKINIFWAYNGVITLALWAYSVMTTTVLLDLQCKTSCTFGLHCDVRVRRVHMITGILQKTGTHFFLQNPRNLMHTGRWHLSESCSVSGITKSAYTVSPRQVLHNEPRLLCSLVVFMQPTVVPSTYLLFYSTLLISFTVLTLAVQPFYKAELKPH